MKSSHSLKVKLIVYVSILISILIYFMYITTISYILEATEKEVVSVANEYNSILQDKWTTYVNDDVKETLNFITMLPILSKYMDSDKNTKTYHLVSLSNTLKKISAYKEVNISLFDTKGVEFLSVNPKIIKRKKFKNTEMDSSSIEKSIFKEISNTHNSYVAKYDEERGLVVAGQPMHNKQYGFVEGYVVVQKKIDTFIEYTRELKYKDEMDVAWVFTDDLNIISSPKSIEYPNIFYFDMPKNKYKNSPEEFISGRRGYQSLVPLFIGENKEPVLYVGVSIPIEYIEKTKLVVKERFLVIGIYTVIIITILTILFWRNIGRFAKQHEDVLSITEYDPLTSTYTREHFEKLVSHELKVREKITLFMIDVGGLNKVNDLYGYMYGDRMLMAMSQDIKNIIGDKGIVGRFSGAEFFVALYDLMPDSYINQFAKLNNHDIEIADKKIPVRLKFGVVTYPDYGKSYLDLVLYSDIALASIKNKDDIYNLYTSLVGSDHAKTLGIEFSIIEAMAKKEFFFVYQPQVDTSANNKIIGFELLLRWQSQEHGFISPGEFIPIVEEKGFAERMNIYVVKTAVEEIKSLEPYIAGSILKFAINLSPAVSKFDEHLRNLKNIISNSGLNFDKVKLEFEITESCLAQDKADFKAQVLKSIELLKNMNVSFALDDFGMEYSSLNRVIEYPFNTLKIDRCFVQKLDGPKREQSAAVIKAILMLQSTIGFNVVVEGVETEEHLKILSSLGVEVIQGFYFYKPQPKLEIIKLLS